MPSISCAQLTGWGNIQQEISERGLQTIERKVKNVERDDRKYDGRVVDLPRGQYIGNVVISRIIIYRTGVLVGPISICLEKVDKEFCQWFTVGKCKGGKNKSYGRENNPETSSILRRRRV